jgi:hypothetical protein
MPFGSLRPASEVRRDADHRDDKPSVRGAILSHFRPPRSGAGSLVAAISPGWHAIGPGAAVFGIVLAHLLSTEKSLDSLSDKSIAG